MSALMVQGTSSAAGKSLLTAALARALHRRGVDVAPFKAQNVSNNARVADDGEMGAAQYLQALAAGLRPQVRMNPILIKPEGEQRSQVVVLGRHDPELSSLPWRERQQRVWPVAERALRGLSGEHDVMLLEGAGSPAEINLRDVDLANMRAAAAVDASVLLIADIDRGGAFAHLYGTWALLGAGERARIVGFVLNKFRGERDLLAPAPETLEALTGVRTVGVMPWLEHGLPDEDGVSVSAAKPGAVTVAVVRYPTASNLDEFRLLEQVADVRWVQGPEALAGAQIAVLPGSKHVAGDLAWLCRTGLDAALRRWAAEGRPLLGICGGMQMLGASIVDEGGVDGSAEGLGLLPIDSVFARGKRTERTLARFRALRPPWDALAGQTLAGYQIRHGRSAARGEVEEALADGLGLARGAVLGIYLHGLFEQPGVLQALFGAVPRRSLELAFDELADAVEEHIDVDQLLGSVVAR